MSAFVIVWFSFLSIVELSRKEVIDVFKSVSDFDSAIKKVLKMFLDGKTSNEIRNSVGDIKVTYYGLQFIEN